MYSDIDSSLHGTLEGYRAGCRGQICEAPVRCSEVYTRWVGDWQFRKAYDAGEAPIDIIARLKFGPDPTPEELAKAEQEKKKRTKGDPKATSARRAEVERKNKLVKELYDQNKSDQEISDLTGIPYYTVRTVRVRLGLKNRKWRRSRDEIEHGTPNGYVTLKCRDNCPSTPTCRQAANAERLARKKRDRDAQAARDDSPQRNIIQAVSIDS